MPVTTCQQCGEPIQPPVCRGRPAEYCSPICRRRRESALREARRRVRVAATKADYWEGRAEATAHPRADREARFWTEQVAELTTALHELERAR